MTAPRISQALRKGEWRRDGLTLAQQLRAQSPQLPKIEIARAINASVSGAPRNIEAIATWLREREQDGDLATSQPRNAKR